MIAAAGFENEPHPIHSQGPSCELGDDGQPLPQRPLAGKAPLDIEQGVELGAAAV
jgi:hypothetical protein